MVCVTAEAEYYNFCRLNVNDDWQILRVSPSLSVLNQGEVTGLTDVICDVDEADEGGGHEGEGERRH